MANTKFILIFAYLKYVFAYVVHIKLPELNVTDTNLTSHLKYDHIHKICNNRHVCNSNNTVVCAVRREKDEFKYKNFENSCFLFLSNMCDHPGEEFSIAQIGECTDYTKSRRMYVYSGADVTTMTPQTIEKLQDNVTHNETVTTPVLRKGTTFSTIYDVDTAFDYHPCPLRCPDVYSPVCVSANRGLGKYFKFWTFVNHCAGDLYYCKNWQDFAAPDDEDENVNSSPLGWSYCGAHRYLQFARFTEVTSAMGHYGWLQGDYRYSHIMEPHQRKPGFG